MKAFICGISMMCFLGCAQQEGHTPSCLKSKIETFSKEACDKSANVKKYTFQGSTVYVLDPGTCGADMTSEVIDKNCSTLGHLGGIIGNTKINNTDFSEAKFRSTVWER